MTNSQNLLRDTFTESAIQVYDYKDFATQEHVGHGGFASVRRAYWKSHRKTVALKTILGGTVDNEDKVKAFVKELTTHRRVCFSERVLKFYGMTQDPATKEFAMILHYANQGHLRSFLKQNFSTLTWTDKLRIAVEIADGLQWLHAENVIHRDLHSKNVLMHENGALIADFGIAKLLDTNLTSEISSVAGMAAYVEPQCFLQSGYVRDKPSCDIYSLGVLLWELSSGSPPFATETDVRVIVLISGNQREKPIDGTPPMYVQLYQACWQNNPLRRPSSAQVLQRLINMQTVNTKPDLASAISQKNDVQNEECDTDITTSGLAITLRGLDLQNQARDTLCGIPSSVRKAGNVSSSAPYQKKTVA